MDSGTMLIWFSGILIGMLIAFLIDELFIHPNQWTTNK